MKKIINSALIIFIIICMSSCSNNKDEDEFFNPTINKAFEWYAKHKSIEYGYDFEENKVIQSNVDTEDLRIKVYKVKLGINDESKWDFAYQNYDYSYLSLGKALIQIETYFNKNSQLLVLRETYYFDLFEDELDEYPLPLKGKIEILENGDLKTIRHERVWKGDYDYIIGQINAE